MEHRKFFIYLYTTVLLCEWDYYHKVQSWKANIIFAQLSKFYSWVFLKNIKTKYYNGILQDTVLVHLSWLV